MFFDPLPRALAHRGNSVAFPENTEAAFRSALELGADVLETDVRLTADGKAVISHDPDFRRLSGETRNVEDLKSTELQSVDLGEKFSCDGGRSFPLKNTSIHPLLLEEAFRLFPESRFNIDLKLPGPSLAGVVADTIRRCGAEDRVCVGSFHHSSIKRFREMIPEVPTSLSQREMVAVLLLYRFEWAPPSVRKGEAPAVQIPEFAGPFRILSPAFFRWCKKWKLHLQVWTVNDKDKMKALFEEGVEGIFSDIPEKVVEVSRSTFS